MKKAITWGSAIKLGVFSAFVGIILFLIIEVAWAQILQDTIIAQYETGLLTIIIISGFLLSIIIALIASLLTSDIVVKKYALLAGLYSFFLNLLFWMILSFVKVKQYYPEIITDLSFIEKIIGIFQIMANYAIYILNDVSQLWTFAQITFAILFIVFLKVLGAKQKSTHHYDFSKYK